MTRSALLVAVLLPALSLAQAPPAPAPGQAPQGQRPTPVVSPDIGADGKVTFRLRAPGATEVSVTGLSATALPMTKTRRACGR